MENGYSISLMQQIVPKEQYFIIFELKGRKYAINICNIVEVINIQKIEISQILPQGIIGMLNYNSTVIKAIDLCPFLGLDTPSFSINNKMIIANFNNEYFAIYTENIQNITKFDETNLQNIPFSLETSIINQIYRFEDKIINIIDEKILYKLLCENTKAGTINYEKLFPNDEKSEHILNLRSSNNIKAVETFSFPLMQSFKQYILFEMDKQNYYMDIKYVKEFISVKRLKITKLPYTPEYIAGIVSVKGEFFVVINLKKFLDNDSKTEISNGKLIVVEYQNFNIAFLVDDIKYIRSLKEIEKSGIYSSSRDYIYAEFMENDELYSILNFEKILNDNRMYINID